MVLTKKKIVYIIFSNYIGSGVGGHYYSLREISKSIKDSKNVSLINIGFQFSQIFRNQLYDTYFIKHQNIIKTILMLKNLIEKLNPDILHTFDFASLALLKIIMIRKKVKHIHTVCGGPNPKYFPFMRNLILFSQENYDYFRRNIKSNDIKIYLIPNRVHQIKPDLKRISILLNKTKMQYPIFLRICRINKKYFGSIVQSINIVKKLRMNHIKANLIIVGVPDNIKVLEFIKKFENNYIKILTHENFTLNASQIIEAADFVIGTGRSFMEGAYFSKVMLVPQKNQNIPLLVDEETFEIAFKFNFSERMFCNDYNDDNFIKLIQCIDNKKMYKQLATFIKNKSEKYFEISNKIELYIDIYDNLNQNYLTKNLISFLKESPTIIKILYNHNIISICKNVLIKVLKIKSKK